MAFLGSIMLLSTCLQMLLRCDLMEHALDSGDCMQYAPSM